MTITGFVPGWIDNPVRRAEVIQERQERGDSVYASSYSAANPKEQLEGAWTRAKKAGCKGIFLRDAEFVLLGNKYRRPYFQKFGTCVSRGVARGIQASLDYGIVKRFQMMEPVEVSFAPIYTLARHEVGKDRCGSGDGAILADAAQAVHDYGVATTSLFPGMNEDQVEQAAVRFAAPRVGTPAAWIQACKGHTVVTFSPDNPTLLCDCLAAGYAVPYAMNYVTGNPNSSGISGLGSFGPHCRVFLGVFVDEHGDDQVVSGESWDFFPAAQPGSVSKDTPPEQGPRVTLKYAGGQKILGPGEVGVSLKKFSEQIFSNGEAWATGVPQFKAESVGRTFATTAPEMGVV